MSFDLLIFRPKGERILIFSLASNKLPQLLLVLRVVTVLAVTAAVTHAPLGKALTI